MRSALAPILFAAPRWRAGATIAFDFTQNRAWLSSITTADALLTTTRASEGYADNAAGIWQLFASGQPRITDKGLLVEEARTNVVLHNRDLTNAAWTPTNIDAAKDQAGVDGVANSASSITATDANGTILQAITLASSARWQTCFIKRITGTGDIEMTMDNGSTWTAVTVTSAWTRVAIATQTLANPTVGFRIVISGDAVAVDFVQNENSGAFATSPIRTTSAAATRAADVISLSSLSSISMGPCSLFAEWLEVTGAIGTAKNAARMYVDASNATQIMTSTGNKVRAAIFSGGVTVADLSSTASVVAGTTYKAAAGVELNNFALASSIESGVVTDTGGAVPTGTITVFAVGHNGGGGGQLNGYLRRVAYFPARLAQLQVITT